MIYIRGMHGLGDNIYQRGYVKLIKDEVYLETPWPQLYSDLEHVKLVKPYTKLRTQSKNLEGNSNGIIWHETPDIVSMHNNMKRIHYGKRGKSRGIVREMSDCFGFRPKGFDLPDFRKDYQWIEDLGEFALIRPLTERKEWLNRARNPKAEYLKTSSEMLKDMGIKVISIADIQADHEWALDPMPYADVKYHNGELTVQELLALVHSAKYTIGGVGWIVPASLCYNNKAWIILGGHGAYNSPEFIMYRQPNQVEFAMPDNFCRCNNMLHDCNKEISNYEHKFAEWLRK